MAEEEYREIGLDPDEHVLLVSIYTPAEVEVMEQMQLETHEELYAYFKQVEAADPGFVQFETFIAEIANKHDLRGGWTGDDQMLLRGPDEAISKAFEEISPHYSAGVSSGAACTAYLIKMQNGDTEVENLDHEVGASPARKH